MVQNYTFKNSGDIKGHVLMGGSLMRDKRTNNNSTGETHIDHPVPTLTIAGTRDGLYRITRNAEAYFHHVKNVNGNQRGLYPVVVLEGLNHASFMNNAYSNAFIKGNDLLAEVGQD